MIKYLIPAASALVFAFGVAHAQPGIAGASAGGGSHSLSQSLSEGGGISGGASSGFSFDHAAATDGRHGVSAGNFSTSGTNSLSFSLGNAAASDGSMAGAGGHAFGFTGFDLP